jgi:hypothetical protein
MLSARQRREASNVELVQGLTWINLSFAGKRNSFSPALGLGLLSQLLVVPLKPSRRHSNDAQLHMLRADQVIEEACLPQHESVFAQSRLAS